MNVNPQAATRLSNPPLGTSGDLRRRFLRHHVPLALVSAGVLVVFMTLPLFDATTYPHGDLFSAKFPKQRQSNPTGSMDHGAESTGPGRHSGDSTGSGRHGGPSTGRKRHGGESTETMRHGGESTGPSSHAGVSPGPTRHGADHTGPSPEQTRHHRSSRQFTVATGYIALALLALTLLIGPANLLLRRRNPISNYLSRDVGTWAAIASVVHVIFGLHVHGGGRIRDFLNYFVAPDGSLWTNSFGLANWTGLAALVIVVGLLAISSDAALRKLKARPWKRLQRLNYGLFVLVILHAVFYGAVLRLTSPYTLFLGLSVVAVFVGQAVGIWLWRQRYPAQQPG
jgi:sulfoxide reductase heme-binding subunit YedZ